MKTRNGFVSNSSSSSFMIATKGELTEQKLIDAFNVPKDSFLYAFAKDAVSALVSGVEETITSVIQLAKYYDWLDAKELEERHQPEIDLLNGGMVLYIGSVSDGDYENAASMWLCYNTIEFDSDDLIIQKEGGY